MGCKVTSTSRGNFWVVKSPSPHRVTLGRRLAYRESAESMDVIEDINCWATLWPSSPRASSQLPRVRGLPEQVTVLARGRMKWWASSASSPVLGVTVCLSTVSRGSSLERFWRQLNCRDTAAKTGSGFVVAGELGMARVGGVRVEEVCVDNMVWVERVWVVWGCVEGGCLEEAWLDGV